MIFETKLDCRHFFLQPTSEAANFTFNFWQITPNEPMNMVLDILRVTRGNARHFFCIVQKKNSPAPTTAPR